MKLTVEIGRGFVAGYEETWGEYLCVVNENDHFIWSNYFCFDIDFLGDGCRLPTEEEILDFINEVKKKFPDAVVEDGTGVLAAK